MLLEVFPLVLLTSCFISASRLALFASRILKICNSKTWTIRRPLSWVFYLLYRDSYADSCSIRSSTTSLLSDPNPSRVLESPSPSLKHPLILWSILWSSETFFDPLTKENLYIFTYDMEPPSAPKGKNALLSTPTNTPSKSGKNTSSSEHDKMRLISSSLPIACQSKKPGQSTATRTCLNGPGASKEAIGIP